MPLHDWTRESELCFLDQHFAWTVSLCRALNLGLLPADYFALIQPDAVLVKRRVPPAQRIEIQHAEGRPLVAVIEMIAPAHKADAATIEVVVKKSVAALKRGVLVAIVDVLPDPAPSRAARPTPRSSSLPARCASPTPGRTRSARRCRRYRCP